MATKKTLKDVFQAALDKWEWSDKIEHDDSDDTDYISTDYSIDQQKYRLVIFTDERTRDIVINLYSPIIIPPDRQNAGAFLMNFFNSGLRASASIMMSPDGKVVYKNSTNVSGTSASVEQFEILKALAGVIFESETQRTRAIGAVAFTKQSIDSIIEDFLSSLDGEQELSDDEANSDIPDKL